MAKADILSLLRTELNDPSGPNEKYSDELLELLTNTSLNMIYGNGIYTIDTVPVAEYDRFNMLVLSKIYQNMAAKTAEYFDFESGGVLTTTFDEGASGDSFKRQKTSSTYLKLSNFYYDAYIKRYGSVLINPVSGTKI